MLLSNLNQLTARRVRYIIDISPQSTLWSLWALFFIVRFLLSLFPILFGRCGPITIAWISLESPSCLNRALWLASGTLTRHMLAYLARRTEIVGGHFEWDASDFYVTTCHSPFVTRNVWFANLQTAVELKHYWVHSQALSHLPHSSGRVLITRWSHNFNRLKLYTLYNNHHFILIVKKKSDVILIHNFFSTNFDYRFHSRVYSPPF